MFIERNDWRENVLQADKKKGKDLINFQADEESTKLQVMYIRLCIKKV